MLSARAADQDKLFIEFGFRRKKSRLPSP